MLETFNRFLLFPFIVSFILGFLYYSLLRLVNCRQLVVENFNASGSNTDVTTAISKACSTAKLPLQLSRAADEPGVMITTPVSLCNSINQERIIDNNGNQVYGRLRESDGKYTLSYFTESKENKEILYSFKENTQINFKFQCRSVSIKLLSSNAAKFNSILNI